VELEAAIVGGTKQIGSEPALERPLADPKVRGDFVYCAVAFGHGSSSSWCREEIDAASPGPELAASD
jgi:hypothetical protein